MSKGANRSLRQLVGRALVGALAGVAVVFIGMTAIRLWTDLSALQSSPSDNVQWTFAQIEVDLLNARAAARAVAAGAHPDELRTQFNLFYSRIATLERGAVFAELRSDPKVAAMVERLSVFLHGAVDRIDGPDDALAAAAPGLDAELSALAGTARALALEGVRIFAARSDERRARFKFTLTTAAALAAALIAALLISLGAIERQRGVSMRRAAAAERIGRHLSATVGASLDAVIVADSAGRIIDWNEAAERMFGIGRADAIGRDMDDLIVPEQHRAAHRAGMRRYLATGEKRVIDAGRLELTALRSDGREFPVELAVGAAEGEDGPLFVSYLRDISDRLAAERKLRDALDAAMSADRAKSGFIAVMSHEMRTPLNGVLGLIDLLRKTELDERQRRLVENAAAAGEILLRQVNDVLEIARAKSGRLALVEEPVDAAALLAEAIEVTRPLAEANRDEVRFVAEGDFAGLLGDARRIRQIALNLLGNAVKFTKDGRVDVALRVLDRRGTGARLELRVEDDGPGVPEADRERIFEEFVMLDSSYEREAQGSGLGLAIVRRVAEAMGGAAWMEPAESGGSRFIVRFELAVAAGGGARTPAPDSAAKVVRALDILLVDDNALNRMVFTEALEAAGHRVAGAENGKTGVEAAERSRFDVVLMDISMPVMNGVEAARAIRGGDGPNRATPIIGLTAHALPEELARFAEAGIATCLTKPLSGGDLERALAGLSAAEDADGSPPGLFDEDRIAELAATLSPGRFGETIMKACAELEEGRSLLLKPGEGEEEPRALSHRLAGTAALIGAVRVHRALADLTTALARGLEEEERAALAELDDALPATLRTLRELAADRNA